MPEMPEMPKEIPKGSLSPKRAAKNALIASFVQSRLSDRLYDPVTLRGDFLRQTPTATPLQALWQLLVKHANIAYLLVA